MEPTLTDLAKKHGTDKWGAHYYTPHYETHFHRFRHEPVRFLEIGIGGYDNPTAGGRGLRMWGDWFTHPDSIIIGLDLYQKSLKFDDSRIKTVQGSQVDKEFLTSICHRFGSPDIVVDDGSHVPSHVVQTFEILFPLLSPHAIYAVEDTQTSYWDYGFGGERVVNFDNPTYAYFKRTLDWMNYAEIPIAKEPTYLEKNIVSAHFYHNLLFIEKGINEEPSNSMPARSAQSKKSS